MQSALRFRLPAGTAILAAIVGLLAAVMPYLGVLVIAAPTGLVLGLFSVAALPAAVTALLITKPLIDLAWRWDFTAIAEQGVNAQSLVGVLVMFIALIAVVAKPSLVVRSRIVVTFMALMLVSVGFTPTSWGVNELIRVCSGICMFFIAGRVLAAPVNFNRFAVGFLLAVSVPIVLALLQAMGVLPFEYWDYVEAGRIGRASGTYQHPLGLIYFLVSAVPLALYLISVPSQPRLRVLLLLTFIALASAAVIFSYHRTGRLALALELGLWMVLGRFHVKSVLLLALAAIALFSREWLGLLWPVLTDALQGDMPVLGAEFLRGRGANWYLFMTSLFGSHPIYWVIGRGGSVAEGVVPYFGYWASNEPHNDLIRVLHAYGVAGLAAYLSMLWTFLRDAMHLRHATDQSSRSLGNLMIVVLAGVATLSLTSEPMRYPSCTWYLFALGSVVTVRRRVVLRAAGSGSEA